MLYRVVCWSVALLVLGGFLWEWRLKPEARAWTAYLAARKALTVCEAEYDYAGLTPCCALERLRYQAALEKAEALGTFEKLAKGRR
jgi:hypothetical protein